MEKLLVKAHTSNHRREEQEEEDALGKAAAPSRVLIVTYRDLCNIWTGLKICLFPTLIPSNYLYVLAFSPVQIFATNKTSSAGIQVNAVCVRERKLLFDWPEIGAAQQVHSVEIERFWFVFNDLVERSDFVQLAHSAGQTKARPGWISILTTWHWLWLVAAPPGSLGVLLRLVQQSGSSSSSFPLESWSLSVWPLVAWTR